MCLANWFGLRCRVMMCPHVPTRDGYACTICGVEKLWPQPPAPATDDSNP